MLSNGYHLLRVFTLGSVLGTVGFVLKKKPQLRETTLLHGISPFFVIFESSRPTYFNLIRPLDSALLGDPSTQLTLIWTVLATF